MFDPSRDPRELMDDGREGIPVDEGGALLCVECRMLCNVAV